jgi:aspartate kinase
MVTVVQKFGGTSLGTHERLNQVATLIESHRSEVSGSIIVVSAISPTTKGEGTTNLLLLLARSVGESLPYETPLQRLERFHEELIERSFSSMDSKVRAGQFLHSELTKLQELLRALQSIREVSSRSLDIILSVGERVSAFILSTLLIERGLPTRFLDLSSIVDNIPYTSESLEHLQSLVAQASAPKDGEVVVTTGFVGFIKGGLLNSVGRGYTDFTASLIAAGLGPSRIRELQVWKEVDGVFSSDPRLVSRAKPIAHLSSAEAAEITYFGAEVLHPLTMSRINDAHIPIRIKNIMKPEDFGTVIEQDSPSSSSSVVAVTGKRSIAVCTVHSNGMYEASGFLAKLFRILGDHNVVVDLVSTSEVSVSFTVSRIDALNEAVDDLRACGAVDILTDRATLTVVGRGLKCLLDAPATLFKALSERNIRSEMITESVTGINISCVIREEELKEALNAVHDAFFPIA